MSNAQLMLLIFYSLQSWLTALTVTLDWDYIEINPFVAGIITMGFINGAYFTETFRGAMLAVPRGQVEAGIAYGLSRTQRFRFVVFPQMMRFALPGIGSAGPCCRAVFGIPLRRPTTTGGDCPCTRQGAGSDAVRRADVGTGPGVCG